MDESILESVKIACGVDPGNTDFDRDLIDATNSVLAILTQLGVGPEEGFQIEGDDATWADFIGSDKAYHLSHVVTYVGKKVRMIFDPPVSSAVKDSTNNILSELEWRVNVAAENYSSKEAITP